MNINFSSSRRQMHRKQNSGTISTAGRHILSSLDRAGTSSTLGSEKDFLGTASTRSRDTLVRESSPLLQYYKNRDRHPEKVQQTSQFSPPGMKHIMTPLIKKSINSSDRIYSSIGNGDKFATFSPRTYDKEKVDLTAEIPPNMTKEKLADMAVYSNGNKNTFNDSHFYLGFSSTKRKELASTFKMPKNYQDEMYRDTESVNGLRDKPNHVNE